MDAFGFAATLVPALIGAVAPILAAKKKRDKASADNAPRPTVPRVSPPKATCPSEVGREALVAQITGLLGARSAVLAAFAPPTAVASEEIPREVGTSSVIVQANHPTDSEYSHLFAESNVDRTSQLAKAHWKSAV